MPSCGIELSGTAMPSSLPALQLTRLLPGWAAGQDRPSLTQSLEQAGSALPQSRSWKHAGPGCGTQAPHPVGRVTAWGQTRRERAPPPAPDPRQGRHTEQLTWKEQTPEPGAELGATGQPRPAIATRAWCQHAQMRNLRPKRSPDVAQRFAAPRKVEPGGI